MSNNKLISVGVIFTFIILIAATYFSYHEKSKEVVNDVDIKDNLLVDILSLHIIRAVKNQYKLGDSSSIGFSVSKLEVFKREEKANIQYDVLTNVEVYKKRDNGLTSWHKDTLKYSISFDPELKIELIDYQQDGWDE
ncbi:DUF3888 domain-containing protein [Cytobacillus sp. Hm23]